MADKLVDENTSPEEAERLFRKSRNARRQERRDWKDSEPEPRAKPEPIVELTEIVAELIEIVERVTVDQPIFHKHIASIKDRINELRYGS